jgi:hypothetical protein
MFRMRIGLLACAILGSSAALAADLPAEGSFKATFFGTDMLGKKTTLPTAESKTAFINEQSFVYTNDAGSGFMHRATGRCLVSATGNNTGFHASGPCTYADRDGDLIFSTFDIRGSGNSAPTGTKQYIGGTGKYAGLSGQATYTIEMLKPVDKDAPSTIEGHVQGSYKLGAGTSAGAAR